MNPPAPAPQSPFLPNTNIQFAWDSTSLGYLKTCPRLYQYIMIEGWGAKDESIHLWFGRELHTAIEEYEREKALGVSHHEAVRHSIHQLLMRTHGIEVDLDTKAGKYKNRKTLVQMVCDYLDHYEQDPTQTYIQENGKPAVELSFRFELDWGPRERDDNGDLVMKSPYLLCGHLDRVASYSDSLFVLDHKTSTSTLGDYFFNQFEPNNQMTLYTLAARVILNAPIKGVIIDGCQIKLRDPNEFKRAFTYRTNDQIDEWLQDLHFWFGLAETYANANYWPMNDTACDKYGGCRFREICSKSPQVRERFLKSNFTQLAPEERWNPLKPR